MRPVTVTFDQSGGRAWAILTLPDLAGMAQPLLDPTVTLQPGAADGLDTYTEENSADTNYGSSATPTLRTAPSADRYGLFRFDYSAIPAGATVVSSAISVWNHGAITSGETMRWARILPANAGWEKAAATWNHRATGLRWAGDAAGDGGSDASCSVAGADYSGATAGSVSTTTSDPAGTEYSAALLPAEVQALLADNHGLHLRLGGSATTTLRASDHATAATRPRHTIEYTAHVGPSRLFAGLALSL